MGDIMNNSFYDFIVYNAFEALLAHSDKRCLSINELHLYRLNIVKEINEGSFLVDSESAKVINNFLQSNYQMSFDKELDLLSEFIIDNDNLFEIKEDKIFIKENLTAEDLLELKFELDTYVNNDNKFLFHDISEHFDDLENLKILGADKINNEIYRLLDLQNKIEKAYKNPIIRDNQNIINSGNLLTAYKLRKLFKESHYNINSYYRFLNNLLEKVEVEDLNLLNEEIVENDDFYQQNNYIDALLETEYMDAIFGDNSLAIYKLYNYLDILETYKRPEDDFFIEEDEEELDELFDSFLEEEDEYIDEFDDEDEEELEDEEDEEELEDEIEVLNDHIKLTYIFYLKYIESLDKYQIKYGFDKQLMDIKNRLIYLLDQFGYDLYKDQNLNNAINAVSGLDINYRNDLHDFYVISRLFIFDMLETNEINDLTLKKVLFISTYYNFTKDKRIKNILEEFRESNMGLKLYDSIINGNINKMSNEYVKKLNKKEK